GLALSLLYRPLSLSPAWPISPATAIIGALAGYLTLWLIFHAFRLATGKEGMGYGDFKLLAALGAWLGWKYLPLVIVLSAAVGLIVAVAWMAARRHQRGNPIPFGPFLAAAGWISLLWGEPILRGYLHFAGLR
ncbi:MAG: A24 family peptidase, partial [Gammaproteobacteria bacterium]